MYRSALVIAALLGTALPAAAQTSANTVTLAVTDVKTAKGQVLASLCSDPAAPFPGACLTHTAISPARPGETTLTFTNVPNGRYALQVFHDENGDSLPAIPPEGFAFGNNAAWQPSFDKSAFTVSGDTTHTVRMQYISDGFTSPAAYKPAQEEQQ